ncbi:MAG TPA: hypothetical protein ENI85_15325 [Deltaproteobacteria bacterium]|nr:hypothetical protein [Deltaproteobacteria bacterium]
MTTHPSDSFSRLRALVAEELREPVRPNVDWLARQIAERHGETVLGVLFYGSCLRQETDEGVLDFWVVVDDYDRAYRKRWHALANRIAPPNVFYLELDHEGTLLRTKYGVIDRRDFERGTSLEARHPYVWARFAQPARALACRDEAARAVLETAVAQAIVSMVGRLVWLLPNRGGLLRFTLAAFWQEAFRRTYDSERRPEADALIRGLYGVDPERYDRVAALAILHLASQGRFLEATPHARSFSIAFPPRARRRARLRWRLMRSHARFLGLVRLLKTAFTFGDWVPYVLWKLERHTGRRIELTDRQRRHPLIFAWPIILPLLRKRNLR